MKYKKGAKVEVLNKREVPSGSWWCAEIISGNGHTYSVMYDPSPPGTSGLVERVPRKVIRPCPPLVGDLTYWVSGDIVEILDNASWKLAEVLSAVDESYFLVRLLGSARAFKVYKSNLRQRQCWQGNGWVVIGKDVRSSEDGGLLKEGFHGELNYQKAKGFMQNCEERTAVENDRESSCVPSGIKKRGLRYCSAIPESCCRVNKKLKAGDKEGTYQQLAVVNLYQSQQKVDAVTCPQKMLGEGYMHTSLNNKNGLSETDMEGGKPSGAVGLFFTRCLDSSDVSVCSSSGSNDLDMLYCYPLAGAGLSKDSISDDANSSCWLKLRETKSIPTKRGLASKVHNLELYAYRTTMEALYSHGSITWEQEELMTNLRLELHISNDEHLSELKHLSSSKSSLLSYIDATAQSL